MLPTRTTRDDDLDITATPLITPASEAPPDRGQL